MVNMKFKIMRGFGQDDFIPIEEEELEKAIYCHMARKDGAFNMGSINGSHISAVMPDWHGTMGWNYAYKLTADDWDDIRSKGVDTKVQKFIEGAKNKVQYLIETKQENLIGKGFEMPKIETSFSDEVKRLAESKQM